MRIVRKSFSETNITAFGEVFTPPVLINEMLTSIPVDFWKQENIKILDNSCGDGAFLLAIKNIMVKYHNPEQVNKMLYGVDIQNKNVELTRTNLGMDTNNENIICADALQHNFKQKFDLIVGNPPYNKPKHGKRGNDCHPLWPDFVKQSIFSLKEGGYLLYVHPPLYRKPGHKIGDLFRTKQIVELHMFDVKKSTSLFNCFTKVDWYLLKNTLPNSLTKIVDEKGEEYQIDLSDKLFIPNHSIKKVYTIFSPFGKIQNVIYSCAYHHYTKKDVRENRDGLHIYSCVYLINKKGIVLRYSASKSRGHFGIPKIIFSMGTGKFFWDKTGEFGMCEIAFGIPIENDLQGETLMHFFQSEKFQKILNACCWKTVQNDYKLFQHLNVKEIFST